APAPSDSRRYCSSPPVYSQRSCSCGFSTSSVTSRPGQSTAFARSACLSRDSENAAESKYLGLGQKRTVVPVVFLATLPTTSSFPFRSPSAKLMLYSLPSRRIHTSSCFDSALTTETPTP